jgi:hypothetical protein
MNAAAIECCLGEKPSTIQGNQCDLLRDFFEGLAALAIVSALVALEHGADRAGINHLFATLENHPASAVSDFLW